MGLKKQIILVHCNRLLVLKNVSDLLPGVYDDHITACFCNGTYGWESPYGSGPHRLSNKPDICWVSLLRRLTLCGVEIAQHAKNIERIAFQLDLLNKLVKGPYVSGDQMGLADAALFPTLTFVQFILPQLSGWKDIFEQRKQLGPILATIEADPAGAKVGRAVCLSNRAMTWNFPGTTICYSLRMQLQINCSCSPWCLFYLSVLTRKALQCVNGWRMQVITEIEGGLQKWVEARRWQQRGVLEQVAQKDYKWSY